MQFINSLNELNLPWKYKKFLEYFLVNLAKIENIERVILFGSCARGTVHKRSDVDLLIIGDGITDDEEDYIYSDCGPEYPSSYYSACDIFTSTYGRYNEMKTEVGSLQWRIERDGKDLTAVMNGILT